MNFANIFQESLSIKLQEDANNPQPQQQPVQNEPTFQEVCNTVFDELVDMEIAGTQRKKGNYSPVFTYGNLQVEVFMDEIIRKNYPMLDKATVSQYILLMTKNQNHCLDIAFNSSHHPKALSSKGKVMNKILHKLTKTELNNLLSDREAPTGSKVDDAIVEEFLTVAKDNLSSYDFNTLAKKFASAGKSNVADLTEEIYNKPDFVSGILVRWLLPWDEAEKILYKFTSFGSNISFDEKSKIKASYLSNYEQKLKSRDAEESTKLSNLKTEFNDFYTKKRTASKEADPSSVIDDETYKKIKEAYDKAHDDENALNGFSFKKFNPKYAWIDDTFADQTFIGHAEFENNKKLWLEFVMALETTIYNSTVKEEKNTAEAEWETIVEQYNSLIEDYNKLMEDKEVKRICSQSSAFHACLRHAGGSISYVSKVLGLVAYGLGAFIPGGNIIAEPLSWLVKHTNRAGRLIQNAGSKLEDKKKRKTEKDYEKARKKDTKEEHIKVLDDKDDKD